MQDAAQVMINLGAPAQGLAEAGRADRHHHEFLKVGTAQRVLAAVHDIHHRRRQNMRVYAAQIGIQRQPQAVGRRVRQRQRYAQNGVGAKFALGRRAVNLQHQFVERLLTVRRQPRQFRRDNIVDRRHRSQNAFAQVARLVAVAHFQRLVLSGRGAARHDCAAQAVVC